MPSVSTPDTAQKPEAATFGRERPAPGAYYLDLSGVATAPLKDNGQPTTFAEVYGKLRDAKILRVPERFEGCTFQTDAGEVTVSGELGQWELLRILRDLIDLHKEGIDPHRATWFYYGHDWSRDADEMYFFFVVHGGKIVRESVSFMHCYPRVLTKVKADDEPIWTAEPYEQQAWETFCYRKFYTETITGQLTVLRPDKPILYNYSRAERDMTRDGGFVTLVKIYRLLWVAVPLLAAIAYPKLWLFMAVIAALATADLLWTEWATRKAYR